MEWALIYDETGDIDYSTPNKGANNRRNTVFFRKKQHIILKDESRRTEIGRSDLHYQKLYHFIPHCATVRAALYEESCKEYLQVL